MWLARLLLLTDGGFSRRRHRGSLGISWGSPPDGRLRTPRSVAEVVTATLLLAQLLVESIVDTKRLF